VACFARARLCHSAAQQHYAQQQQPQGYYAADGQLYPYPAQQGYAQQQPQGYYAADGQWYPYPQGYDPNQAAYAQQQPQGYYAADGQWYAYPQGYDPNQAAYAQQGYDPNQAAYAQQGQYAADPNAAYSAGYAQQQPYAGWPQETPAYAPPAAVPAEPENINLGAEDIEIPALTDDEPWKEPAAEPPLEAAVQPPETPFPEDSAAEVSGEDVLEMGDSDVTDAAQDPSASFADVTEELAQVEQPAPALADTLDVPTEDIAFEEAPAQVAPVAAEAVELGEDDFSSLDSEPAPTQAPVPEASLENAFSDLAHEEPLPVPLAGETSLFAAPNEVLAASAELFDDSGSALPASEPLLAEEQAPASDDPWASAPLAVEASDAMTGSEQFPAEPVAEEAVASAEQETWPAESVATEAVASAEQEAWPVEPDAVAATGQETWTAGALATEEVAAAEQETWSAEPVAAEAPVATEQELWFLHYYIL
jgi:hypothetical protein